MTQSGSITLGGKPCVIADEDKYPQAYPQANSYRCPRGAEPGRAFVLISEKNRLLLNLNDPMSLVFDCGQRCTFKDLYFVRSHRVSGGHRDGENSVYMAELADVRHLLCKMTDVEVYINVRCPAPPDTTGALLYYDDSLNGAAIYSWQDAINELWPTDFAGAAPALPFAPAGVPENWRFQGVSAWYGLHEILEKIGCTTAYDPFAATFTIVRMGETQPTLAPARLANAKYLDDANPVPSIVAHIPESIHVYFHRAEQTAFGLEKDSIQGADQWAMNAVHVETAPTNVAGALANTSVALWDDLPAIYDSAGVATNAADLATRATDRTTEWVRQFQTTRDRYLYSGCLTDFLPGSEVVDVVWQDIGHGYTTGVVCGAAPNLPAEQIGPNRMGEHLQPPDHARRQFPLWPRTDQIVQPWNDGEDVGALLEPNAEHVIPGRVMRYTGPFAELEPCWILPMSLNGGTSETAVFDSPLFNGDRLLGRLQGNLTSSGDTRPLYVVESPRRLIYVECSLHAPQVLTADWETVEWDKEDKNVGGLFTLNGAVVGGIRYDGDRSVVVQVHVGAKFWREGTPVNAAQCQARVVGSVGMTPMIGDLMQVDIPASVAETADRLCANDHWSGPIVMGNLDEITVEVRQTGGLASDQCDLLGGNDDPLDGDGFPQRDPREDSYIWLHVLGYA